MIYPRIVSNIFQQGYFDGTQKHQQRIDKLRKQITHLIELFEGRTKRCKDCKSIARKLYLKKKQWKKENREQKRMQRKLRESIGFCVYCGLEADTIDHIIPKSRGGSDEESNLTAACFFCNQEKADMTYDEYMAYRKNIYS